MKPNRIRPCSGPCNRMTRPSGARLKGNEGTIIRYNEGECKACFTSRPQDAAHPYTLQGLNSFLRRRRDRENAVIRRMVYTAYPHLLKETA